MAKLTDQILYPHHQRLKSQKTTRHKKKPLKITYISSPRMVKVCNAMEFRAIVQELTGKNSKIMDPCADDTYLTSNIEESTGTDHQACNHEAPPLEMNIESVDGAFLDNACSSSPEMDDGSFWRDFTESLVGVRQSSFIFV
ncbi:hypothetical protein Tsubulata_015618 [Turnera subulata]|uniref:VQ domain-containing protein n=1 Tax=Turnera subulata TaxID=218843 RepID=A0A9Q0G954_9ROSI|nr:hypothetical protein Tsubulata_015618 [Turnera subulata]